MSTPAANQVELVLSKKFPGMRFGRVNCRKISGSSVWSQHSWNNARDLYPPRSIPYLSSNDGEYRRYLDEVWAFLVENQEDLNIRVRLWQVKNHYNHIHVDMWPRGWSTPPCAGGAPRYKYPNGDVRSQAVLINTYKGDFAPITPTEEDVLQKGDEGKRVGLAQERLLELGYELPNYGADEDFGNETEAAVKEFQADRGLPTDGVLYSTDIALLHDTGGDQGEGVRANARLDDLKEAI